MRNGCFRFLLIAAVGLVLAGCHNPKSGNVVFSRNEIVGYSTLSRPVTLKVAGDGDDTILIIAAIHGNEVAGVPLANTLFAYMEKHHELMAGKTVMVVPVANPDGYKAGMRNSSTGVDLNRNFPAANRVDNDTNGNEALTDPESRILYRLINRYRPSRIVSIHQPLACIDYDGPAEELAKKMAKECYLPVKKLGSRPGSLGSWAGNEKNIPIVTLELKFADSELTADELWEKYGNVLLAAVAG